MECKTTNKMIDSYVKLYFEKKIQNEDTPEDEKEFMEQQFRERTFEKIKNEIFELEKERIVEEAEKNIKQKEEFERLKRLKLLMYEGFFIAFIVGLIVNQTTELINLSKGIQTKIGITLAWLILLGMLSLLIYNVKYISDVLKSYKQKSSLKEEE